MVIKEKQRTVILFGAILALGVFLRSYQLTREKSIIADSIPTVVNLCKFWFSTEYFPTFFVIRHYWVKAFGTSMLALHSFPVICGMLSMGVMFVLGKRLYDIRVGMLAAYLFAVSTIHIFHSQFNSVYIMNNLFILLSFLFFLKAVSGNSARSWFGYVLFTLLALFSSYSSLPILICQMSYLALLPAGQRRAIGSKKIFFIFGLIFLIYLPVLVMLLSSIIRNNYRIAALHWIKPPSLGTVMNIFSIFSGRNYNEVSSYSIKEGFGLAAFTNIYTVFLSLLCMVGIFGSFRPRKDLPGQGQRSGLLLSLWLVMPVILSFAYSHYFSPVLGPARYIVYVSCAYYLLISKGVMFFNKKIRIFLVVFIMAAGVVFLREYYRRIPVWERMDKEILGLPRIDKPLMHNYTGPIVRVSGEIIFKEYRDQLFKVSVRSPACVFKYGPPDIAAETYYKPGPYTIKLPKKCGEVTIMATVWDKEGFEPNRKWSHPSFILKVGEGDLNGVDFLIQ